MAAGDLFQSRGFHATGIDLILQEAGAAKASLYQHFGSKDALAAEVLRFKSRKVLAWLKGFADRNPGKELEALFAAYAEWFEEDAFRGCLFSKAAQEYPDRSHPAHKAAAAHTRKLFCYLDDLCRNRGAPAGSAEHLLVLLEGATGVAAKTGAGRAPADRALLAAQKLLAL